MKVVNLKTENFKKVRAVDITPQDNTVMITGKNGEGKTSLLDSLFVALTGSTRDLKKPIRDGESRAEITVDMGDYVVVRTFTEKTNNLKVTNKDGSVWPKPQTMLDDIVGRLSFDPLDFTRKKEKEQRDILLDLAGVDLEQFNQKRQELYNKRHEVGIEGKTLNAYPEEDRQWAEHYENKKPVDIEQIKQEHAEKKEKMEKKRSLEVQANNSKERIAELEQKLKEEKEKLSELEKEQEEITVDQETVDKLEKEIEEANVTNRNIEKAKEILEANRKVNEKRKEYQSLDAQIKELDEQKKQELEKAKMPIEGLEITEDGVLYSGIPLSQVSTSEKIKVGIAISMELNPKLRIIRIDDGSLLDSDNLKTIQEMTKDKDYQVWIESVDNNEMGFYIEDGEIKNNS